MSRDPDFYAVPKCPGPTEPIVYTQKKITIETRANTEETNTWGILLVMWTYAIATED